ncbi:uncharacterized protein CTHT_0067030 [Thermochaetoides thermophila DSM 1495]|uniref:Transcription initiation factor TFIID subunit 2 n=1 Tax=Chaetomium thermophilum (strain DSM 1495 / CBS 144.50 / IMI 039719) TaxID=759272 RepID=G0SGN9_CHATD|nr:hypothetical protein CTHT_0067030 [Thermochaetoides thermophila DSM 1495]EGS17378.1 hypothetical protein CTHT_0067030 [Thermochaetoides thermophila DSM 1495]
MPAPIENEINEPAALEWPQGAEPFVVIKQEVELDVDLAKKQISGVSTLWIFPLLPDMEEISLDARNCEIDLGNVTVDGVKTQATFSDPYDLMQTPSQWQIGATQHHILKKRMASLRPIKRPEVPNLDRVSQPCSVPCDGALKISLRPEGMNKDEPRRILKIKTLKVGQDSLLDAPDPNDKNGLKISIPFRSKHIRDGIHFVGCDEGDQRYPHVYTRHSLEPGTACCIFPCVDDPASRHPWKISIKCPRTLGDAFPRSGENTIYLADEERLLDLTVICSGNLIGEQIDPIDNHKKIMTFESQLTAAQHIAFAIGPFEHIDLWSEFRTEEADEKLGVNAAKIHAYCLPRRADEVRHTCAPIVRAADFFAPEFGRYPYDSYKICFVDDMVSDTVTATSMSLCSNRLLYTEDLMTPRSSWLVVGIQWFMTDLFMRSLCGNNWYRFHIKTLSDRLVEVDVHRPSLHDLGEYLHVGDFELEFMSLKAPLVLFILDQRMSKIPGSSGIVRVISQLVSNANINTTIETTSLSEADFRKACEKKSQYRPDELWEQWVHGAGCPKLSVKQRFNKKNLNVDITITQVQAKDSSQPKAITKDVFQRELFEEVHEVWAGPVPKYFTGPITIRVHEADGTPYEHYLSISDKDKGHTQLQIAYNTKYKRMKRTKKAIMAAAAASTGDKHDIQEDDIVYFNMLGDVLMSPQDAIDWGLQDWSESVQQQMDQESYEWIRFDCNFEWLCALHSDMPGYMYSAQLQQDRDVVAHQDAMLFFSKQRHHAVTSTIDVRTVMDRRYFYGIRVMAAHDLTKQANPDLNCIGKAHLILLYRHFFCDKVIGKNGQVTYPPAPNDFYDKAQYEVQCAIPQAIARIRENGFCPRDARRFLLDLLVLNAETEGEYSDHFYICKLLQALTTSIIPEKYTGETDLLSSLRSDDPVESELKDFIKAVLDEIEKYRRKDEWELTWHNIWTTTTLDCKMRLMKARVIPVEPIEFVRYLQDENLDLIRIKAHECLVELGLLARPCILRLFLADMTSCPSPFVRDRLFKIFCRGLAAIALGESSISQPRQEDVVKHDDGDLILEAGESEIRQRKLDATRNQSIQQTIAALKDELKDNMELQDAMWKAIESPWLSAREKHQLLTVCSAMWEPDDSLLMTFNYPKIWKCTREVVVNGKAGVNRKSCIVRFTTHYRTEPRNKRPFDFISSGSVAGQPSAADNKPPEPKRIRISRPSISLPSGSVPPTPSTAQRKDSISVSIIRPAPPPTPTAGTPADSIAVQPLQRVSSAPLAASPPPMSSGPSLPPKQTVKLSVSGAGSISSEQKTPKASSSSTSTSKKRKSDDADAPSTTGSTFQSRSTKKARTASASVALENGAGTITANGGGGPARPRRVVTVPFKAWHRLPERIYGAIAAERRALSLGSGVKPPLSRSNTESGSGTGAPSRRITLPTSKPSSSSTAGTGAQRAASGEGSSSSYAAGRTALPSSAPGGSSSSLAGSSGSTQGAASQSQNAGAGNNGNGITVKKARKPLPTAAPKDRDHSLHGNTPQQQHGHGSSRQEPLSSAGAGTTNAGLGSSGSGTGGLQQQKKVIKLKLKVPGPSGTGGK